MTSAELPYGDPSATFRDDLFRRVNGAWLEGHVIPDDRAGDGAMRGLFDAAEENVRTIITDLQQADSDADPDTQMPADLYASFMDVDTIEQLGVSPLREQFQAIADAGSKDELAAVMGRLEQEGVGGLLAGFVSADAKNSDRYALYFEQSGLSLPDESYYRTEESAPIREAFLAHLEAMSRLGGLSEYSGLSDADFARTVFDFETAVAEHHWDNVRTRDAEATYNPTTPEELRELAAGFDLDSWLEALGIQPEPEQFIVREPDFVTGAAGLWNSTELPTLKAWLLFGVLSRYAGYLSSDIVEEDFGFFGRTLSGTPELRERWKRGISTVEGHLGELVGKLYVQKHFPPASKQAITELVDNLLKAYENSIRDLDWMTETTKTRALEKLSKFSVKVGYPDVWREYSFTVTPDDLVGNIRRSAQAEHRRQLDRISGPVDRTEWFMTPQTVNAYFHPVLNEIVFPAAILQPPMFDAEASDAANYGAIGAVIGHEIGHGFDDQGSRYDGDGNLVNWWTDEDRAGFEERTRKLIDQYSALSPWEVTDGSTVNGELTIGENIGDLGGLGISWKALQLAAENSGQPLSQADREAFFCQWAAAWRSKFREEERKRRLAIDPHSPEEFRCNQVVKNMDAFAETFGTQPGDGMYLAPEERVTIW